MRRRAPIAEAVALLALAGLFLTHDLGRPSLYVDELVSVEVAAAADAGSLVARILQAERRPPLYHFMLAGWRRLAGDSDPMLRFPSIAAGLIALAGVIRLGGEIGQPRAGLAAGLCLAVSPALVQYARLVRPHATLALWATLATLFLLRWLRRPEPRTLAAYWAAGSALVYSDYAAVAVLLIHNAWLITMRASRSRPVPDWAGRPHLRRWLATQMAIAAVYVPWLAVGFGQIRPTPVPADLATSPLGLALKVAYPLYAFTAGENLFPWRPVAWVAVGIGLAAAWLGARRPGCAPPMLAALAVLPVLAAALASTLVVTDSSFVTLPSRILYALPFAALLIGLGLAGDRPHRPAAFERREGPAAPAGRPLGLLALSVFCASNLAGLVNLYAGRDALNPIYGLPAREIAAFIGGAMRDGDVVVADWDSAVPYYLRLRDGSKEILETPPPEKALARLRQARPAPNRVWVVRLGRDRTRALETGASDLIAWLEANYPLSIQWHYGEQDPAYLAVKAALLRRPAYRYRATVTLYASGR